MTLEFRPLSAIQVRELLEQCRTPPGVKLPHQPRAEEAICGHHQNHERKLRLLARLVAPMERILEVNGLHEITKGVVGTARETLVMGEA